MKDNSEEPRSPQAAPGVHSDGASRALTTALQKTFESLLQEPVPEKFNQLIARIRAEEKRRADENGGSDK